MQFERVFSFHGLPWQAKRLDDLVGWLRDLANDLGEMEAEGVKLHPSYRQDAAVLVTEDEAVARKYAFQAMELAVSPSPSPISR